MEWVLEVEGVVARRAEDRGVFVILESMVPTRLLGAFPPGVEIVRCGLADAIAGTRGFLAAEGTTQDH